MLREHWPVIVGLVLLVAFAVAVIQLPTLFRQRGVTADAYRVGVGMGLMLGLFITAVGGEIRDRNLIQRGGGGP